jgi:hypothetical protein
VSDQNPPDNDRPWDPSQYPPPQYPPPPPGQDGPYNQPYGQPPQSPYPYSYGPPRPPGTNGKAIAALVLGIAGLVVCQLVSIAAIVVGSSARRETSQTGQAGYGFALSGLILGWIGVALLVLVCVMFVLGVSILGIGGGG